MTIWQDFIESAQAVLQVPTMLVDVATTGASKLTGEPTSKIPKIPQSVINAASGQFATPEDVQSAIDAIPLPTISLPDFSIDSLFPQTSNLGKYALYGGVGLVALMLLMKPSPRRGY